MTDDEANVFVATVLVDTAVGLYLRKILSPILPQLFLLPSSLLLSRLSHIETKSHTGTPRKDILFPSDRTFLTEDVASCCSLYNEPASATTGAAETVTGSVNIVVPFNDEECVEDERKDTEDDDDDAEYEYDSDDDDWTDFLLWSES